jgi:hypothetical protein
MKDHQSRAFERGCLREYLELREGSDGRLGTSMQLGDDIAVCMNISSEVS